MNGRFRQEKWTVEEAEKHLQANKEDTYSMAVVTAALFHKLYGRLPKLGLSGQQGEYVMNVVERLPDAS